MPTHALLPAQLATSRLLLRAPQIADAEAIFAEYAQDPEVCRYMVWRPHAEVTATRAYLDDCGKAWDALQRRPYVLQLAADARAVGMLEARFQGHMLDLGYVLTRRLWGQGLMSEAVQALSIAALATPTIFRVQATCDTDNPGSARVLERAGFRHEGVLERYTLHPNLSNEPRACHLYARCR